MKSEEWMAEIGRLGGSSRSERKAIAAAKNGAKGGRPRVAVPSPLLKYWLQTGSKKPVDAYG